MNQGDFDEEFYLNANPDVKLAVSKGRVKSGREHYEKIGHKEDREKNSTPRIKFYLVNWFVKNSNFSSFLEISTLISGKNFYRVHSYWFLM